MQKEHKHIFDQAFRTADSIVSMFGKLCEVAVHDFSNLDESLVYIVGKLTNRKNKSPVTNLVLQELQKEPSDIKDMTNYKTISNNGLIMKSSTIFLRDQNEEIIGALCINIDISLFIQIGGEIQDFIRFDDQDEHKQNESFYSSVNEIIEDMVNNVVQPFNKAPSLLSMEEKIECVRQLEQKGAFMIKGTVEYLGSVLNVSKFTIYNYLQKIRAEKDHLYRSVKS